MQAFRDINSEVEKSSRECFRKSSVLHRNLMVNSVLNKVRTSEKSYNSDIFLNYREPRSIEMDIEEQEIEKINTRQRQNQQSSPFSSIKSNCKQQSPVPSIQSSLTRPTTPIPEANMRCEYDDMNMMMCFKEKHFKFIVLRRTLLNMFEHTRVANTY